MTSISVKSSYPNLLFLENMDESRLLSMNRECQKLPIVFLHICKPLDTTLLCNTLT